MLILIFILSIMSENSVESAMPSVPEPMPEPMPVPLMSMPMPPSMPLLEATIKKINSKQNHIEEKLQANGKLLQDFIIFFDKRITSIEEHMQGLHYNYTSCCHHLVQMEIAVAQLSSKIREHIVPQQDRLEL